MKNWFVWCTSTDQSKLPHTIIFVNVIYYKTQFNKCWICVAFSVKKKQVWLSDYKCAKKKSEKRKKNKKRATYLPTHHEKFGSEYIKHGPKENQTQSFFSYLKTLWLFMYFSRIGKKCSFFIYRNKQIGYIFKSISWPVYSFSSRWENFQVFILWEVFMWRWSVWAPSKLPAVRFWDIQM